MILDNFFLLHVARWQSWIWLLGSVQGNQSYERGEHASIPWPTQFRSRTTSKQSMYKFPIASKRKLMKQRCSCSAVELFLYSWHLACSILALFLLVHLSLIDIRRNFRTCFNLSGSLFPSAAEPKLRLSFLFSLFRSLEPPFSVCLSLLWDTVGWRLPPLLSFLLSPFPLFYRKRESDEEVVKHFPFLRSRCALALWAQPTLTMRRWRKGRTRKKRDRWKSFL